MTREINDVDTQMTRECHKEDSRILDIFVDVLNKEFPLSQAQECYTWADLIYHDLKERPLSESQIKKIITWVFRNRILAFKNGDISPEYQKEFENLFEKQKRQKK